MKLRLPDQRKLYGCSVGVSPDGKWIFTGGRNQEKDAVVRLWDMKTLEFATEFVSEEEASILAMSLSRDGEILAVAGHHSTGWDVGFRWTSGYPVRLWKIRRNLDELLK